MWPEHFTNFEHLGIFQQSFMKVVEGCRMRGRILRWLRVRYNVQNMVTRPLALENNCFGRFAKEQVIAPSVL